MRRQIRMKVSCELLEQLLKMPDHVCILHVEEEEGDFSYGQVTLTLTQVREVDADVESLPEVPEGARPPLIQPVITHHAERHDWDFSREVSKEK